MTILAVSENQGVKTSIFDKNNSRSAILWAEIPEQCFQKKKQQIVFSLDFSVSIICSNTKN